ncbi:SH3 domain-containing protein [Arsenicitalea aurantiaca]|uniref:SH3 domain-containing protein n=1 Tax=Arsenicitalea aurantiaca TaxID=1783274 RepID=A0A433XAE9_9HYPH|nr:SH3 domain-containing protein [Arsenicitalea aurantiaca]RUT31045.1 SH3 domain-containing protein [Arsenicitalea aurantiaca]
MKKNHEKLLVATLAGMVIASAAVFAVQPAMAAGYHVEQPARVTGVAHWDHLNVRKWPASYSQKTGELSPNARVWVERCIVMDQGADWCLIERGFQKGWVNSRYLTLAGH